ILEQILGETPPPPPPDVPSLPEEKKAKRGATLRERLAEHSTRADCVACHKRIDPLGFALENYDAIGRWRETEEGHPIDSQGVLPDGRQVEGASGLRQVLKADPDRFRRTLAEQ